jgi:hypothetical protein
MVQNASWIAHAESLRGLSLIIRNAASFPQGVHSAAAFLSHPIEFTLQHFPRFYPELPLSLELGSYRFHFLVLLIITTQIVIMGSSTKIHAATVEMVSFMASSNEGAPAILESAVPVVAPGQ